MNNNKYLEKCLLDLLKESEMIEKSMINLAKDQTNLVNNINKMIGLVNALEAEIGDNLSNIKTIEKKAITNYHLNNISQEKIERERKQKKIYDLILEGFKYERDDKVRFNFSLRKDGRHQCRFTFNNTRYSV